jgi:hypothetical protein
MFFEKIIFIFVLLLTSKFIVMAFTKRDLKFFALGILSLMVAQLVYTGFKDMYKGFHQEWQKEQK